MLDNGLRYFVQPIEHRSYGAHLSLMLFDQTLADAAEPAVVALAHRALADRISACLEDADAAVYPRGNVEGTHFTAAEIRDAVARVVADDRPYRLIVKSAAQR